MLSENLKGRLESLRGNAELPELKKKKEYNIAELSESEDKDLIFDKTGENLVFRVQLYTYQILEKNERFRFPEKKSG